MENWKRKAWKFIYEQRIAELKKAIRRFPFSDRLKIRQEELQNLEKSLKEIEQE